MERDMDMRKEIIIEIPQEQEYGFSKCTTITANVFVSLHQNASGGQVTWGVDAPVHEKVEEFCAQTEVLVDRRIRLCELTAYQRRLLDAAILEWVIDEQLSTGGA
jgi:hypothetical protein